MIDLKNINNNLFNMALKNFKLLVIIGIVAGILSVVFSSPTFIPPKYKSTAIVYPSNLGEYSEESPIEQMLQWFDSRTVKDLVIEENNLPEHYEISKDDPLYAYYMMAEYNENITISETKYESAEIIVLDTEPQVAADIVNSIIKNFNKVISDVHKHRATEDLKTATEKLNRVKSELDSVVINLNRMEGLDDSHQSLKLKVNIADKSSSYILYNQRATDLNTIYYEYKQDYNDILNQKERVMTYTNVVSSPQVPVKKVYPVRWVIVILSILGAVAFTFILLLFSVQLKSEK
ncbi:MAG: hypothetical protein COB15_04640 [Flavobacteriales bacterium]|nr:MAG: hypothetical protein COB15_04640 [Flavobacteriales bacterium]